MIETTGLTLVGPAGMVCLSRQPGPGRFASLIFRHYDIPRADALRLSVQFLDQLQCRGPARQWRPRLDDIKTATTQLLEFAWEILQLIDPTQAESQEARASVVAQLTSLVVRSADADAA